MNSPDRTRLPRVVAEVRADYEDNIPYRLLYVSNDGGSSAYKVTISGTIPNESDGSSSLVRATEHAIEVLAVDEARYVFGLSFPAQTYARNVRVRYLDESGNKYITEYRSIGEEPLSPIFREPGLGGGDGFPAPAKSSAKVSWPIEDHERTDGFAPESVEPPAAG